MQTHSSKEQGRKIKRRDPLGCRAFFFSSSFPRPDLPFKWADSRWAEPPVRTPKSRYTRSRSDSFPSDPTDRILFSYRIPPPGLARWRTPVRGTRNRSEFPHPSRVLRTRPPLDRRPRKRVRHPSFRPCSPRELRDNSESADTVHCTSSPPRHSSRYRRSRRTVEARLPSDSPGVQHSIS